jgi:Zn-dependent peptidase ImmA (M78 family)
MALLIFICLVVLFFVALINDMLESRKKWVKAVPYSKLVNATLQYTNNILFENKISHFPKVHILYKTHPRFKGYYRNSEIYIYTKSNESIEDIVLTILHELKHYIDHMKDPQYFEKFNKNYDFSSFSHFLSYTCSPLEISANEFAYKHQDLCLKFLAKKGVIKKV